MLKQNCQHLPTPVPSCHNKTYQATFKRATSRGFRGFWAQTILKLVVAKLIHAEHYLLTSTGRYNLNLQRKNKPRPLISLFFFKTRGNNLKSLASIFQVAIRFHPPHLQPKTLANSFSVLISQLLTKIGHYLQVSRDTNIYSESSIKWSPN